jgi:hypothetical protein
MSPKRNKPYQRKRIERRRTWQDTLVNDELMTSTGICRRIKSMNQYRSRSSLFRLPARILIRQAVPVGH